jgi:ribosomal protein S21
MGINMEVAVRRNEDPKRAIKRFVKKCKKEGFLREVMDRQYFVKPSKKRRLKRIRRKQVYQKLHQEWEQKNKD